MATRIDLGIDPAGDDVSLAALAGDEAIAERRWTLAATLSQELLAGLDALLREADLDRSTIASIAVNAGPGGYSGLRTGVATAQGLALALGVPLAGVSRLEADAFPHLARVDEGRPVIAVHEAGRAGLAWAAFRLPAAASVPETIVEPRVDPVDELLERAPVGALWCGEIGWGLRGALEERADAEIAGDETVRRSAADVVRLARLHDAYGDPELIDVIYLRPPPITRRAS